MSALEALCETLYKKGRRQLVRHELNCKCVGADENCFAQLVTLSTLKEKEDAMLISVLLSDSSIAPAIVGLAEDFGMGINALLRSISEENSITFTQSNQIIINENTAYKSNQSLSLFMTDSR